MDQKGHYFHKEGLWSILPHESCQLDDPDSDQLLSGSDLSLTGSTSFIDEEYEDQLEISLSPEELLLDQVFTYPSAASFPGVDIQIPFTRDTRPKLSSVSEPDLTQPTCHQSLRNRWERWTTAFRSWSEQDLRRTVDAEGTDGEEGEATPQ